MNPSQLRGAIQSTLRLQETVYNDWLVPEATSCNDNTLWQTYRSGVGVINRTWAFTDNPKPIELIEVEMRFQWREFILAAKNIEANHPAQDRLTWLILWTREMGILSRSVQDSDGNTVTEEALTTQGRIWTDLPFMLEEVQEAWRHTMTSVPSASHCLNLTAAIARLAAIGLLNDAFSGCGLEIMVQALGRPGNDCSTTSAVVQGGGEQIDTLMSDEPTHALPHLLPLIQIWMHYAGRKLLQLSAAMDSTDHFGWSINRGSVGSRLGNVHIEKVVFSTTTFKFWKGKLAKTRMHNFENPATDEAAQACSRLIDSVWDEFFGVRLH